MGKYNEIESILACTWINSKTNSFMVPKLHEYDFFSHLFIFISSSGREQREREPQADATRDAKLSLTTLRS